MVHGNEDIAGHLTDRLEEERRGTLLHLVQHQLTDKPGGKGGDLLP